MWVYNGLRLLSFGFNAFSTSGCGGVLGFLLRDLRVLRALFGLPAQNPVTVNPQP